VLVLVLAQQQEWVLLLLGFQQQVLVLAQV
jgi:hypothetical protein